MAWPIFGLTNKLLGRFDSNRGWLGLLLCGTVKDRAMRFGSKFGRFGQTLIQLAKVWPLGAKKMPNGAAQRFEEFGLIAFQ